MILLIKLAYFQSDPLNQTSLFFQSDSARIDLADVWSKVQSVIQVTGFLLQTESQKGQAWYTNHLNIGHIWY